MQNRGPFPKAIAIEKPLWVFTRPRTNVATATPTEKKSKTSLLEAMAAVLVLLWTDENENDGRLPPGSVFDRLRCTGNGLPVSPIARP